MAGMVAPPPKSPGQVRIVGGRWRGTKLRVLDRPGLRPTSDRVRETLFNWLMPALPGARVLDLFAGTGALGLEALSPLHRTRREALKLPPCAPPNEGFRERAGQPARKG